MALSAHQTEIIRSTAPVLQQYGNDITTVFYRNLIRDVPALNNIFNRTNQVNGEQPRALAQALFAYATHITDLGVLSLAIERIAQKHVSLGVEPAQYDVVGKYLLAAMGEVLGDALTDDILDAWAAAYTQLANVFIEKETKLYEETNGWAGWREFKIKEKIQESENITSFYLLPVDGAKLPSFYPGQYVSLRVRIPDFGYLQPRQYSLSEAPNSEYYRLSIKRERTLDPEHPCSFAHHGMVSNVMHDEKSVGDVIELTHPHGEFFLDTSKPRIAPVVLMSVGVGLTPMISILNALLGSESPAKISWINGTKSTEQHAFGKHVHAICQAHDNFHSTLFKSVIVETDEHGVDYHFDMRIDLNKVHADSDLFLSSNETDYFICGPEHFMAQSADFLRKNGVENGRIHLELFGTGSI
jgi:nitric oxide dioxygenase